MGPRGHGKGSTGWLLCEPAFQKSKARVEGFIGQDLESGPPSPHLGRTIKRQSWERAPGAPLACVAAARTGAGGGAVPRRGGAGVRARAEEAAEPGGLAAAVAPPTRVRTALRPPPRVPPASVSGLGRARGAGQGVGPSSDAVGARARSREGAGDARRRPRCRRQGSVRSAARECVRVHTGGLGCEFGVDQRGRMD